jgi:FkbM family methyltransferase
MSVFSQDPHWSATADFLRSHFHHGDRILAPVEFKSILPDTYPYAYSQGGSADQFAWVLIHKGILAQIQTGFLQQVLSDFEAVFANAVFVVFFRSASRSQIGDLTGELARTLPRSLDPSLNHFQVFLQSLPPDILQLPAVQQRYGLQVIDNVINNSIGRGKRMLKSILRGLSRIVQPSVSGELGDRFSALEQKLEKLQSQASQQSLIIPDAKTFATMSVAEFTKACRAVAQTSYLGDGILLCRVLARYLIYADSREMGLVPSIAMNGYWEPPLTLALAKVLQPGWNCVDVGANHGYYTVLMAAIVGQSGQVAALEPNPKLAELTQRSVTVNRFQDVVTVTQQAVSDRPGDAVKLVIPPGFAMNASFVRPVTEVDQVVEVQTTTVDDLTRDWETVDLIKIDVEGAEELVWRGMQKTVQRDRLIVLLEFNCDRYADPRGFLSQIVAAGLKLAYVDADGSIKPVTLEQCLTERIGQHWMLFLQK